MQAQFRPLAGGMKVTADAGQQGKFTGQNGQTANLFGRLHAIHYFQSLTAGLAIFRDQAPAVRLWK